MYRNQKLSSFPKQTGNSTTKKQQKEINNENAAAGFTWSVKMSNHYCKITSCHLLKTEEEPCAIFPLNCTYFTDVLYSQIQFSTPCIALTPVIVFILLLKVPLENVFAKSALNWSFQMNIIELIMRVKWIGFNLTGKEK